MISLWRLSTLPRILERGRSRLDGFLNLIESLGNRLPDPTSLFIIGTIFIMLTSHVVAELGWSVVAQLPPREPASEDVLMDPDAILRARSLLTRDGIDWALRSMVDNFRLFPPLGVILVGMLGIGVAERTGLIGAALRASMSVVSARLLTPAMIFLGIMSSLAVDAGYIVLPPLAAALYKSAGRSPLAGIAAAFAGVSAGFNANLFITAVDPILAGFTETGARVVHEGYRVNPASNLWFMIASTIVITLVGWAVTARFVEPRLANKPVQDGGGSGASESHAITQRLSAAENRGLKVSAVVLVLVIATLIVMVVVPGAPLHTYSMPDPADATRRVAAEVWTPSSGGAVPPEAAHVENGRVLVPSPRRFSRWVDSIVPMLLVTFLLPGIAFGIATGTIRSDRDVGNLMTQSMAAMAPIIVLAFVAGQFIKHFEYSRLDTMLAISGGQWLSRVELSASLLILSFIGLTLFFNLFVGSMSAKYALFAPIFVPMFMMVGISPELTQAAYRIGDAVSNVVTPFNPYLIIVLAFMQKYVPSGGTGTLIATMLPYAITFSVVWPLLLICWVHLGLPLGPDGALWYDAIH